MRSSKFVLCAFVSISVLVGCDRGQPDDRPAAAPSKTSSQANPPQATLPSRNTPEDIDIDAARDPRVRMRAKELNAIDVAEMRNLKLGDEVVVLVRADRGGGTIYGSGPYTLDSQIRKAVIHNGALKDRELGIVRVKVTHHEGEHPSTPANGIVPTKWGKYHLSYTIEKIDVP